MQHWRTINASYVLGWLVLFAMSSYVPTLRPIVLIPLIVYAANVLESLTKITWRLQLVKQASFMLLICLGIFVMLTHMKVLASATPQEPLLDLVERANVDDRLGAILTTTDNDDSIRFFTDRTVIALAPDDPLWQSVALPDVGRFLQTNDVRFIILTPEMTQGRVWQREEGMLFLIQNNEKFINVKTISEYHLWLVLQEFV